MLNLVIDIFSVRGFIEMIHGGGGKLNACKAIMDLFHLTKSDLCPKADNIVPADEFYK